MKTKFPPSKPTWWKEGVVYQIYPASFKDSNDDGIGDIPGILSKLDYIKSLGVTIIWISPHYKSPQVDMGYDISDFEDIHEPYGKLQDCLQLIDAVHERGMKIIFDLVINHTSDQHPWFIESRSSKTNPKRDWYFWRSPKIGSDGRLTRPNNWRSQFTKPAWTWDQRTEEYYLHVYASGQPDLNWENIDCRRAVYETAIKFWLDRGVDGFRVDTVNKYSKVPGLPDAPITEPDEETQVAVCHYANGPKIHDYLKEMQQVMSGHDVMTVGELPSTPDLADVLAYIGPQSRELDMVFNFDTVNLGQTPGNRFLPLPFDNSDFKRNLTKWQRLPETHGAWTTVFLENHDQGRSVSRFASDQPQYRETAAKMLAMVLSTMTGTLFLYQGQEIGMINAPLSLPVEEYKCVRSVNYYTDVCERTDNDPESLKQARANLHRVARDHARFPMQWDAGPNAGFCSGEAKPWMSVLDNKAEINVASQIGRQGSVLEFWRCLIRLRKEHAALFIYGSFEMIEQHRDVLMFLKTDRETGHRSLTVVNLYKTRLYVEEPPQFSVKDAQLLVSNIPVTEDSKKSQIMTLGPFEGRVYLTR
ncbi:alpha amylase, catalytic domain-containing protein [Sarocladium implicatum]|nr:alpha amylase, catalytic domain-containing protein [Sarocladium implicatum]